MLVSPTGDGREPVPHAWRRRRVAWLKPGRYALSRCADGTDEGRFADAPGAGAGEAGSRWGSERRRLLSLVITTSSRALCPSAPPRVPSQHHRPVIQVAKRRAGTALNPGRTARVWRRRDWKPGPQACASKGSWCPPSETLRRPRGTRHGPAVPSAPPATAATWQCIFDFRLTSFVWVSWRSNQNASHGTQQ